MNPSPNVLDARYLHPSVWKNEALRSHQDWILDLTAEDLQELDQALASVKTREIEIPAMSRVDFPLPRLSQKLNRVLEELENGRGVALIRGLPIERYSKADAARIYWGVGSYLGSAEAQNAQGDMLGHVRDLGADWNKEMNARGYQTRLKLPFHNDSTDVVGLLCLSQSKRGGASKIVSSAAIHNEFCSRRPDLWKVMCEPFYVDRRGEHNPHQKPYYVTPCFNHLDGRLFVRYNRSYIESAQRFADVPRLTPLQVEALDLMDELCDDEAYCANIQFEPGDMQFLNNYVVLHSREEYEDWPERERKRHLLRLWLRTPGYSNLPAAFADRNADMAAWKLHPRAPIFDISEIKAELAH